MTDTASTTDTAAEAAVETTIGQPTGTPLSVPVTFVYAGVTFERSVNACVDATGAYDAAATADRVADVARTVKYRIETGLLVNKPAEAEATSEADAPTEPAADSGTASE